MEEAGANQATGEKAVEEAGANQATAEKAVEEAEANRATAEKAGTIIEEMDAEDVHATAGGKVDLNLGGNEGNCRFLFI